MNMVRVWGGGTYREVSPHPDLYTHAHTHTRAHTRTSMAVATGSLLSRLMGRDTMQSPSSTKSAAGDAAEAAPPPVARISIDSAIGPVKRRDREAAGVCVVCVCVVCVCVCVCVCEETGGSFSIRFFFHTSLSLPLSLSPSLSASRAHTLPNRDENAAENSAMGPKAKGEAQQRTDTCSLSFQSLARSTRSPSLSPFPFACFVTAATWNSGRVSIALVRSDGHCGQRGTASGRAKRVGPFFFFLRWPKPHLLFYAFRVPSNRPRHAPPVPRPSCSRRRSYTGAPSRDAGPLLLPRTDVARLHCY